MSGGMQTEARWSYGSRVLTHLLLMAGRAIPAEEFKRDIAALRLGYEGTQPAGELRVQIGRADAGKGISAARRGVIAASIRYVTANHEGVKNTAWLIGHG